MNLIVTIDTEADNQWKFDPPKTIENVFALPRFQTLCEKHHITPTYFTTYEVAADLRAATVLKGWQDAGKAEIGAHLHPWTTLPLFENENGHSFPSELSDESLRAKFISLHELISRNIGRPTSYRAGRWGFDMRQATLLAEFGYIADSSITPGISWKGKLGLVGGSGGPDFSRESVEPYLLNGKVLEVPMTILPGGFLRRPRWLRIFSDTTSAQFHSVIRAAQRRNLPAIVFMIHSSELVAGESPYVKDAAALEAVYARLKELFSLCEEEGISSRTLSAFAQYHRV